MARASAVTSQSRKDRHKETRSAKKKRNNGDNETIQVNSSGSKKRTHSNKSTNEQKKPRKSTKISKKDLYGHLDPGTAAALRRDDAEIAALEAKMGLQSKSKSSEKSRLNKEYAKLECYGDDFGDFLDDLDAVVFRIVTSKHDGDLDNYQPLLGTGSDSDEGRVPVSGFNYDESMSDEEEEVVPMKNPALDSDIDMGGVASSDDDSEDDGDLKNNDDSARLDSLKSEAQGPKDASEEDSNDDGDSANSGAGNSDGKNGNGEKESDHDLKLTYRPAKGEDIYGNKIGQDSSGVKPKKYVPPHLRKKKEAEGDASSDTEQQRQAEAATRKLIGRSLNNALNRLSEDTLISVSQQVAQLYESHPTSIVNDCIWKNSRVACIERPHLMTGLIPVYVACIAGVHIQVGDKRQLAEYVLEMAVSDLWKDLAKLQQQRGSSEEGSDDGEISKETSNSMLVLCYLYNYGIVQCSLLYELIRHFIQMFRETDVELLLLTLSHCGRSLRSDDPSALKEIVLMVQKRALEVTNESKDVTANATGSASALSSRVDYMVSAMMDLKNNKRRKQDTMYTDNVSKLRKMLGRIKATVAASSHRSSSSDASLRIGLQDILNAETKGRWWRVGASWVGNQYRFSEGENDEGVQVSPAATKRVPQQLDADNKEDEELLKLAAKARMNTDTKRSIFCIIMKSADCDDAFEKLNRGNFLKNRKERDACRVLMECCGNETSYNPFYAHLAALMCDYQLQCKFSFQLAYWDTFKQFDGAVSIRKAANLAKLLFHLVVVHPVIKLNVIKILDMDSPEDLSEPATIFLTIFFSSILQHFEDPSETKRFFEIGVRKARGSGGSGDSNDLDDDGPDMSHIDHGEGLGESISIFFLQTLKASPKYKKGSKFRNNFKAAVKACDTENMLF